MPDDVSPSAQQPAQNPTDGEPTSPDQNGEPNWEQQLADALKSDRKDAAGAEVSAAATDPGSAEEKGSAGEGTSTGEQPAIEQVKALVSSGKMSIDDVIKGLGLGHSVKSQDWYRLRTKEKALKEERGRFDSERLAAQQKLDEAAELFGSYTKAAELAERGDYIGAVSTFFGKDWDEISSAILDQKMVQDPKVYELEKRQRQLEAELAKEREEKQTFAQRQQQEAQRKAELEHRRAYLASNMQLPPEALQHPLFNDFTDAMVERAKVIMEQTGATDLPLSVVAQDVVSNILRHAESLSGLAKALGFVAQPQGNGQPQAQQVRQRREPTSVSQTRAASPAAPGNMTPEQEEAYWKQQMDAALAQG